MISTDSRQLTCAICSGQADCSANPMSRWILLYSEALDIPRKPNRVELKPKLITPLPESFLSSQWQIVKSPADFACFNASSISASLSTEHPSSLIAQAPIFLRTAISLSSWPKRPLVIAPQTWTLIWAFLLIMPSNNSALFKQSIAG